MKVHKIFTEKRKGARVVNVTDNSDANEKDVVYTPEPVVKEILSKFSLSGTVLDPFKGGGAFYDNFPSNVKKDYCEIREGKDFFKYNNHVDWIVSNPPFSLYDEVIEHSMQIADNIVYLIPISKLVTSMRRIKDIQNYGGIPYMLIMSGAKCKFPMGFPCAAVYFKRGYKGPMQTEIS